MPSAHSSTISLIKSMRWYMWLRYELRHSGPSPSSRKDDICKPEQMRTVSRGYSGPAASRWEQYHGRRKRWVSSRGLRVLLVLAKTPTMLRSRASITLHSRNPIMYFSCIMSCDVLFIITPHFKKFRSCMFKEK
jgi:hypothetical protein